jgi:hypothetical protein
MLPPSQTYCLPDRYIQSGQHLLSQKESAANPLNAFRGEGTPSLYFRVSSPPIISSLLLSGCPLSASLLLRIIAVHCRQENASSGTMIVGSRPTNSMFTLILDRMIHIIQHQGPLSQPIELHQLSICRTALMSLHYGPRRPC